jgi:hypothetical protein
MATQTIKPKRSKYTPKRGRRIIDPERAKAFREERRAEDRERLAEAVASLTTSEGWRRWLTVRSRFHSYSFGNQILIASQCPDATRVAGYRTWQSVGRQVIRGAKAIRIMAPMVVKDKNEETGEEEARTFFRSVSVFDIGQTTGEPLPELPIADVDGDSHAGYLPELEAFAQSIGYSVEYGDTGVAHGLCNRRTKAIVVSDRIAPNHQVKTLIHELAHALGISSDEFGRDEAEVIVESVAFTVCAGLGLDTSGYSACYVASWADGDPERIKAAGEAVNEVASKIEGALTMPDAV